MAKITTQTKSSRGKEIHCSKCGKVIDVGEKYLKATPYRRSPIIRCLSCGLKSYETSGSQYVQDVGEIVENWYEDYGVSEDSASDIVSALEEIKDYTQESLDNMPENLQEGDTGQMLQERIDNLDDVITNLESIDYDAIKEDLKNEIINREGEYNPEEYDSEDDWEQYISDQMDEEIDSAIQDAIEEALSGLEY